MKITESQLRRIIKEALTGPPETVEEWMYWGGEYGLSAEEDNDGQTLFYLSPDQPDRARIAAEAVKFGAQVDTDYEGNDIIYTGMTPQGPLGETLLRRTIRESLQEDGKGWGDQYGRCNTHNISPDEAAEAIAVLQEFGYELGIPITVDSNNIAINDALAAVSYTHLRAHET